MHIHAASKINYYHILRLNRNVVACVRRMWFRTKQHIYHIELTQVGYTHFVNGIDVIQEEKLDIRRDLIIIGIKYREFGLISKQFHTNDNLHSNTILTPE